MGRGRQGGTRGARGGPDPAPAGAKPPAPSLSLPPRQVIEPSQVRKGFAAAIDALDDLKLDVPDVVDQLGLFICRRVPPSRWVYQL